MLALLCRQPCFVDGPASVNALRACISRKSDSRFCAMLTFYEPLSLDPSRAAALCAALPALPPRRDSRERRAGPGRAVQRLGRPAGGSRAPPCAAAPALGRPELGRTGCAAAERARFRAWLGGGARRQRGSSVSANPSARCHFAGLGVSCGNLKRSARSVKGES